MRRILIGLCLVSGFALSAKHKVEKKVLDNGLTVLVRPVDTMQKVSIQLWYDVGSKDEETGERGLAHLLEHMIFKGTQKISESDIPLVTHKLSGSCNAHTSVDYTNYHFDFPVQHWDEALPILADCMSNCTFKQDLLNAEFKAVIQELKMGKDNYGRQLVEKMFSVLFADHPYHYPTIGFKQDLWTVTSQNLHSFYKKHYVPNNAVLVIVGNVNPQDVFTQAQLYFGSIKPDKNYRKKQFYFNQDLSTQEMTLYRDVKNPSVMVGYVIPGLRERNNYAIDVLLSGLCSLKSSRLNKKIVEDLQLANWIQAYTAERFEHDILFFRFEPQRLENVNEIIRVIQEELSLVAQNGLTEEELGRASLQITTDFYSLMEDNYAQGNFIGRNFLATHDEQYINNYQVSDLSVLNNEIKSFAAQYCTPLRMHKGYILPVSAQGKENWQKLQQSSDAEDVKFLSERERKSDVEPGNYAYQIRVKNPILTSVTKPNSFRLSNGLQVFTQHSTTVPKVELVLELKANGAYDPVDHQGLYHVLCMMMYEGTKKYPGEAWAKECDNNAISVEITPGFIRMSMLSTVLEKGLELLGELVANVVFEENALTKIKQWSFAEYKRFLDSPAAIAGQLAKEKVYKDHPYSYRAIPEEKVIEAITCKDLSAWYGKVITPKGARLAVVGDIASHDIQKMFEQNLRQWTGQEPEDLICPALKPINFDQVNYSIDRDQVELKFVGLSVSRTHPDFDCLLLFDQILSGGLNSRLFKLRMKYGFFYRSQGSLVARADQHEGMVVLGALVSKDRLKETETLFNNLIDTVADTITDEELEDAKRIIINSTADRYSTNGSTASTLLFLQRYNLPYDYFAHRTATISAISLNDVRTAVKKVLRRDRMAVIKVGRLN